MLTKIGLDGSCDDSTKRQRNYWWMRRDGARRIGRSGERQWRNKCWHGAMLDWSHTVYNVTGNKPGIFPAGPHCRSWTVRLLCFPVDRDYKCVIGACVENKLSWHDYPYFKWGSNRGMLLLHFIHKIIFFQFFNLRLITSGRVFMVIHEPFVIDWPLKAQILEFRNAKWPNMVT